MPIRVQHAYLEGENIKVDYPDSVLADGIGWAADNGADVLSCSVPEIDGGSGLTPENCTIVN